MDDDARRDHNAQLSRDILKRMVRLEESHYTIHEIDMLPSALEDKIAVVEEKSVQQKFR